MGGFLYRLLYSATGRSRAPACGVPSLLLRFPVVPNGSKRPIAVPSASLKPGPISWRPSRPLGVLWTLNIDPIPIQHSIQRNRRCIRYTLDSPCPGLLVSYTAYTRRGFYRCCFVILSYTALRTKRPCLSLVSQYLPIVLVVCVEEFTSNIVTKTKKTTCTLQLLQARLSEVRPKLCGAHDGCIMPLPAPLH